MKRKLGLLFLGRKRPGFDQEFGGRMNERVRDAAASMGWAVYEPPGKVVDDPSLRKALSDCTAAETEALVTLQTTMADSRLAPTLSRMWPHPVVLWATPENREGDMISSCSLVGVHNWASILRRLHHHFEIVYGDPGDKETLGQLDRAVRTVAAVRRLKDSRIGLIGGHAPGYFAMAGDPFDVWRNLGIQLQSFSLSQFGDVVEGLDENVVSRDLEVFRGLNIPLKDVDETDLPMATRLYLAMRHYYDVEGMDALAVRCWPEMPNVFGQWPYIGMTRLAEEELPIGIEGDVDGALSGLLGKYLGLGPCYGSDWLEHDSDTVTLWHGGNLPFSMSPPPGEKGGPLAARHFNNRKPGVIESTLKPGMSVTVMRLWRLEGRYCLMAFEAETVEPRRHLMGTNGLVRVPDREPDSLFRELCDHGMPHHVAVFQGHHEKLFQGLARIMKFEWIGGRKR